MPDSPATLALKAMLAGIETHTKLKYEAWEYAFYQRWGAEVLRDPNTPDGKDSLARASLYLIEREIDHTKPMTCIIAYGFYAHHNLKFKNEKHLANYVKDQARIPMDNWQPMDDEDWNRIEKQDYMLNRPPDGPGIQIDMGRDNV